QNVASIVTALQVYAADPMKTTAEIANTTITLNPGATATCTDTGTIAALNAAGLGLDKLPLKSSKWTTTTGNKVVLTIKVETNGSITVTSDTTADGILTGKYVD
ncbi:MAG: hypothetical protein RRX92_08730, partial [Lachnospiraceae bacterium]